MFKLVKNDYTQTNDFIATNVVTVFELQIAMK